MSRPRTGAALLLAHLQLQSQKGNKPQVISLGLSFR
jgi:hypothetical protein